MILLLISFSVSFPGMPTWQWPVNVGHGATSSFGEYRGARFHMGLDFSTGGVEGEPIRPAAPGRILKVRAQRSGYGRSIYMIHEGGMTTVYAHLAAFGPKLEAAIRSKGYDPDAYFGTLIFEASFPQLDTAAVIAFSGESGAGLPHFHFEVRDAQNRPIDPLDLGFPPLLQNQGPALLRGVHLFPLDEDARVNGAGIPFWAPEGGGRVQASGRIGLQIAAFVKGPRGSRLGCRGVRLLHEGRLLGQWLPRAISFDDYHKADLVFDQVRSGFGPTLFSYCFDDRHSFLPPLGDFRQQVLPEVDRPLTLDLELMDLQGGWHAYSISLDPAAPLKKNQYFRGFPTETASLAMEVVDERLWVYGKNTDGTLQTSDQLLGLASNTKVKIPLDPAAAPFELTWRTAAGSLKRSIGCLPAASAFTYEIGPWRLWAQDLAPLPPQAIILEPADPKSMAEVLQFVSPVLRFGRDGLPSKGLVAAFTSDRPQQIGIYAWSFGKQRWSFWGGLNENGRLEAEIDYLTPLVAARDLSPPTVLKPKIHRYFRGPRTVIPLRDLGSGIDADTIEVRNRLGPIAAEYDRDRGWLVLPEGETAGPWSVSLSDRAGLPVVMQHLKL